MVPIPPPGSAPQYAQQQQYGGGGGGYAPPPGGYGNQGPGGRFNNGGGMGTGTALAAGAAAGLGGYLLADAMFDGFDCGKHAYLPPRALYKFLDVKTFSAFPFVATVCLFRGLFRASCW
jgi:hypothetical protein